MFTRLYRLLLSRELGVVGAELRRSEERLEAEALKLASLKARFDSLQRRIAMRMTRAQRTEAEDLVAAVAATHAPASPPSAPAATDPLAWPEADLLKRH